MPFMRQKYYINRHTANHKNIQFVQQINATFLNISEMSKLPRDFHLVFYEYQNIFKLHTCTVKRNKLLQ